MKRIQIGMIAHRKPNGEFLPPIPIMREIERKDSSVDLLPINELAEIFADKFKAFKMAKERMLHHETQSNPTDLQGREAD